MIQAIPFTVPTMLEAGLASGSLERFGTIIKDVSSGKIVAHVQETGLVRDLIGNTVSGGPFSPVSAMSSVGANVQLSHLTKLVEGLQILQFVNLGVSLAGIGVSAVGFKVISNKIENLQSKVNELAGSVELGFLEVEARNFREHESRVRMLIEQADQAFSFSKPEKEFLRISHALAEEAGFYRGEVKHLLDQPKMEILAFKTLTQLYTTCNNARTKCLLLADELPAAREVALSVSQRYNSIFDPLDPSSLSKKIVFENDTGENPSNPSEMPGLSISRQVISSLREAQDSAATRPMLLETLIDKNVSGREFMQSLENEKEHPLLCLQVGT